ncbi:uncharacterized protein LOC104585398 isoform X1 [Brachypodium distachyon]|uniref:DUF4220 domain-containing protein n=2 Tax=Brachypodium distachyon TaxID=15368 RepID=A0A0Q3L0T6_BRADI|nr:uncharacterized protein LOC104585398 isoform X1 [Brachypodium distachyon]XP_010240215.1 uncharacterized protein LOC104585398 isoform X1 [Brachypodium distachyon]XP_024313034.1 uncharacterized protein LOC104585398 isoform X1 [Brachypodium distachyon]XP_024313035.1 uncharacterized protein LOC104585398 isoform X1 [Brachypodium distachyon]XP_024313036.1 uncharacterized protein LOC104585398 isoform X1 [Brachypodium distachyon]KQK16937.2 hypothetical protein BRADI_1g31538v3 [Brachypodium distachy|eukprot:XP_010240214.1 uncharacterized protein LOC104585398 isoform X1 [Brachypodium distachyon]
MGGAPTESLLGLWNEWEIQLLVVLSFTLQVFLFFFAGVRRYSISSVLKVLLWLVYLLADFTATYALGHMSTRSSPKQHKLVAFWAPFLLLHLGGQDTITAYALEDNRLWLRHLLNLFVQVSGAAYVLYKYSIAGWSLVPATILVFTAGVIKYGERIWALKHAGMKDSKWPLRSCIDVKNQDHLQGGFTTATTGGHFAMYENIVLITHSLLYIFKPGIIDRKVGMSQWNDYPNLWVAQGDDGISKWEQTMCLKARAECIFKAVEVELSLMYDLLYTKAAVIHTWYGYCIRATCLAASLAALVIFTVSNKDGYSTPDIATSYILLVGASALEIISALKAVGSTWTYPILRGYKWDRLARAVLFIRYCFVVVKDGRWCGSVGQYNLISFCSRDATKTKLKGRIAKLIGLEDRWNRAHYTRHAKLSPALKELVLRKLEQILFLSASHESYTDGYNRWPGRWDLKCTGFNGSDLLNWSFDCEFEESILIWHFATGVFLNCSDVESQIDKDNPQAEAINTLSDYMMYLLTVHRDILPISAGESIYDDTCTTFAEEWRSFSIENEKQGLVAEPHDMILKYKFVKFHPSNTARLGKAVLVRACRLVRGMLGMELDLTGKLQVIGQVWVEMLCHASTNASGDFHTRQLSNGGEFATHVLLLMSNVGLHNSVKVRCDIDPLPDEFITCTYDEHGNHVVVMPEDNDATLEEAVDVPEDNYATLEETIYVPEDDGTSHEEAADIPAGDVSARPNVELDSDNVERNSEGAFLVSMQL